MSELSPNSIEDLITNGEIDTVLVVFPNLQGIPVGKRVEGEFYLKHVRSKGIEACDYLLTVDIALNPLKGFEFANWETGYGDMLVLPDENTLRLVPWLEKTAFVICDLYDHSKNPIEVAPRWILKNQIKKIQELNLDVMAASELEFFLFNETQKSVKSKEYKNLETFSDAIQDYQIYETTKEEFLIRFIRNNMKSAGIPIEFSKGEAGRGQHEINITYSDALTAADNHLFFKNGVKEIAALKNLTVTFMAKYNANEVGSSCHIHSSLWNKSTNNSEMTGDIFNRLSNVAASYIEGIVQTTKDFMILYAPNVNSYKRFRASSWAPTSVSWGFDNRTATHRLVGSGDSLRIESRVAGADCNPYLALAGIIAGGLYGIQNSLKLREPVKGNAYNLPSDLKLPESLLEATHCFLNSKVANQSFGERVQKHLANMAYQEWHSFIATVTDWELLRYFERT
jgi:glutamine synthetase